MGLLYLLWLEMAGDRNLKGVILVLTLILQAISECEGETDLSPLSLLSDEDLMELALELEPRERRASKDFPHLPISLLTRLAPRMTRNYIQSSPNQAVLRQDVTNTGYRTKPEPEIRSDQILDERIPDERILNVHKRSFMCMK